MAQVQMKELLEAGVHFGHQTRRWNPKMRRFIFMQRNGIHILDLNKTISQLELACAAVAKIAASGRPILFVGTKKQVRDTVVEEATRCTSFYVADRWLGGMLTNYQTIRQSIKRLDDLDRMAEDGTFEKLTKKEVTRLEKARKRLQAQLGGIRKMGRLPGALMVIDTKKERIAVAEANKLQIPVCAIVDTNADPDIIAYPIPGNDDAIRSVSLIVHTLADAVIEGVQASAAAGESGESEAPAPESERPQPRRGRRRPSRPAKVEAHSSS